jgi:hypothetical protein
LLSSTMLTRSIGKGRGSHRPMPTLASRQGRDLASPDALAVDPFWTTPLRLQMLAHDLNQHDGQCDGAHPGRRLWRPGHPPTILQLGETARASLEGTMRTI